MMLRIKEPEDFGLGFNSMTRLYMDQYDEEILVDIIKVCKEYLKWFSYRTIICSLRDLIREYPFSWNEEPVPEEQVERYETLIKDLMRQAIGKERQRNCHRELREIVSSIADDMVVTNSRWGKEKNFERDSFYQWVIENDLMEEVVEYSYAAEPPVRCGESHHSGLTEPPYFNNYCACFLSIP